MYIFLFVFPTVSSLFCFYGSVLGELILSVTKDTYEELGLEGKPSVFDERRKPTRYSKS